MWTNQGSGGFRRQDSSPVAKSRNQAGAAWRGCQGNMWAPLLGARGGGPGVRIQGGTHLGSMMETDW